ncbi:la-related protein 6A isoform X2 [Tripterygium wilfordii]|uniref:la-related protein 6A isoform X2 n=1 Tax=Tripterygium wilfordii TaxID=458696 RepID=UPI0018F82A84|nr:la-related protein 6A isoform X2 [Tripterygium wilfordii]
MEGQAGPVAAADVAVSSSPPPHDLDSTTVESSNMDVADVHPPPYDDDQEHGHDNDHGGDGDQSTATGDPTDDLKRKIIKQVEYYFSDENLPTDKYLLSLIKKNKEGFVPISVIASFRKMKKLSRDYLLITAALRESSLLVVSSDAKKVKRIHPLPFNEARDPKFCTVLVENLPEDHSVENIRRIFCAVGNIKNISIRDSNVSEDQKKMVSHKLHALVEYEALEAAEKAVTTLNNKDDWRNGMRVKLYKMVGKNAHRRQAWKESDSEKNGTAHATKQTVDEETRNLSEHHDDSPDEEDGEQLPKEKNGQKGRYQGRSRRNKYHVTNGAGHGTTHSSHVEASKRPPGPRMPDGTRGFPLGRGRPIVSNES